MDVECPLCESFTGTFAETRAHIQGSGGSNDPDNPHTGYSFGNADSLLRAQGFDPQEGADQGGRKAPPEPDVVESRTVIDEGDQAHVAEVAEGTPEELAEHIEQLGNAMGEDPADLAARTERELEAAPDCPDCGEGPVAPLEGKLAEANPQHVDDFSHICLGCRELIEQ